jgi:tetratricopeptide (TPR) repeat protein
VAVAAPRPNVSFHELLSAHLDLGTRPTGAKVRNRRWKNIEFGEAVGVSDRTVRYWRGGKALPADLESIERELFGNDAQYEDARQAMRAAFGLAKTGPRPAKRPPRNPHNGVVQSPDLCIGRDDVVSQIIKCLNGNTSVAVAVLGPPGIGKTTVARQVASDNELVKGFGLRRWYVGLETAISSEQMEMQIAEVIGLRPPTNSFNHVLAQLARKRSLIVLDNLETPWEAEPSKVHENIRRLLSVPSINILACIRGNVAPPLGSWTLPPIILLPLEDRHAAKLFLSVASNISSTDEALQLLLKELGGVPLAIQLTAYRAAPYKELTEILIEWQHRGILLASHPDLPATRLTSVERSIDLSLQSTRLRDEGRRLFQMLGQAPAGMSRDTRVAMLGVDAAEGGRQLLAIGLALERGDRLDLLPPVRDLARRINPLAEAECKKFRHHFLALVSSLGGAIGKLGGAVTFERLQPDFPNIQDAFVNSIRAGERELALAALPGLGNVMGLTGLGVASIIHSLQIACQSATDELGEALCHVWLGRIARSRTKIDDANFHFLRALGIYKRTNNGTAAADCLMRLGNAALWEYNFGVALKYFYEALPLAQASGDYLCEGHCVYGLAEIARLKSDYLSACDHYVKAQALFQNAGAARSAADCGFRLGDIEKGQSRYRQAWNHYSAALALYREMGTDLGEANSIVSMGEIALDLDVLDCAQQCFDAALKLYRKVGDLWSEGDCMRKLGDLFLRKSNLPQAGSMYMSAKAIFHKLNTHRGTEECYFGLMGLMIAENKITEALEFSVKTIKLAREMNNILLQAQCAMALGDLASQCHDVVEARSNYRHALELYTNAQNHRGIVLAHTHMAEVSKGKAKTRHLAAAGVVLAATQGADLPVPPPGFLVFQN